MTDRSTPEIITFGCRLNAYESQVMRDNAVAAGLENTIIVNSCAVTAEAMRQARQAIRRARRARPDAKLIVTGCGAQVDPAMFSEMAEVDHVIGNAEKMQAKSFADLAIGGAEKVQVNDIFSVTETAGHLIEGFEDKARAFVQIQNGCNHRCTFCIIPYGRGNSRSVPAGEVVEQIRRLAGNGYGEVVLSGVDITSWGADLPGSPTLGRLVQQILTHVPELPRLRISSIDSIEVDGPLFDAIVSERRLMPHLHLSLQAGDNMILKRMKRRHSRDDAIAFCRDVQARRPDMVFGADIIAGFPTETEAMFQKSLDLVEDCDLTWLHVFPYSEREGTPAARMPQVDGAVRKERAARLRAAGERKVEALLAGLVGKRLQVLIEKNGAAGALGHSEQFAPVRVAGDFAPGTLLDVQIEAHKDGLLHAVALQTGRAKQEEKGDHMERALRP
ncbi:tRNA (N(6)-L-threonylcarbamoyladenosine(37)-C(2))-methylthiotransferase MtaB [Iodidimonas muriae]|uniref:tRNA (N(6)-L-threonylcarbamoyladenosine(37)-C(2))-methylthiotransferase n=1 Tax=Iodidimonas muriae TaxID=261467 RepID=A0ABQ2LE06_9PROT|nr:tRNA (N(6)-L-threonylcarbamoyladenosine(37)-C(2))-methylthiotransferase MtaB [Iodidimonas muriae]GER07886.1 tRNA (N(6)-L-threonylcarbamoyladenosine(37)-C(2))-methylthiotran sferase MtaB [Kordiimonadales bacterium JCM 17843]GGO12022.1 tRNA (N(6)-L-threonylcarbamoyladenosine(37)-C(2))-methylthiotransferase MtaB [Iodidimonas muriae]